MVRATLVGGQLYVVEAPQAGIMGVGLYFGPGQDLFVNEEQKEQGFNQLMQRVNEDARRWFTEYFIEEMLHKIVDPVYGQGVQHGNYHLQLFGVSPDHQRKGVGKALLRHVEEKARSEGRDVVLETFTPGNVAIYEKMGYEVQGNTHPKHPAFPDDKKIWCLRKRLNKVDGDCE
ncbi:hypothetical protein V5O48_002091 [Marasmius crinis-equi]|uniref:N-acetyltransferase domain-containing protein n=1 Tax=Marasmius crinis-equi TaxID=585013 RepID=A0ABR3FX03_9AGAR